ncbi:DNA oxidative demethylase ALKBH2-like isoform X2 [Agrilus planipennis]|uniref:DNA oxidative demethylase ALKBH2 n=1 Tax=Agrilus planipennis TaxID=224129 RepID=A0A7F5RMT8_AGRPL|nr:DNA oxidative demethylase ALKBH2-like isoform X2 [Agrilus planipennis]
MENVQPDLINHFSNIKKEDIKWKNIKAEGLDLEYATILKKNIAHELMKQLQNSVEYFKDENLTKVKVFGKWHQIPREQSAYGDDGLKYKYSGITVYPKPWIEPLENTRNLIEKITGYRYNFVLINRYRNGLDYIGEHKDDEAELDIHTPIASLSLGQHRDFVLRHENSRKRKLGSSSLPTVKLCLEHGSLLLMNYPTNKFWYHSLPQRKKVPGERINLTFRKIRNIL